MDVALSVYAAFLFVVLLVATVTGGIRFAGFIAGLHLVTFTAVVGIVWAVAAATGRWAG